MGAFQKKFTNPWHFILSSFFMWIIRILENLILYIINLHASGFEILKQKKNSSTWLNKENTHYNQKLPGVSRSNL